MLIDKLENLSPRRSLARALPKTPRRFRNRLGLEGEQTLLLKRPFIQTCLENAAY